jgi:hypothetical protein
MSGNFLTKLRDEAPEAIRLMSILVHLPIIAAEEEGVGEEEAKGPGIAWRS